MEETINPEMISKLVQDVSNLKVEIKMIRENSGLVSQDALVKLWDNEYDEQWNSC